MRIVYNFVCVAVAICAAGLNGCHKTDLSTPRSAAIAFAQALQSGDANAAKNASTGGDPELLDAMASSIGNMSKLRDAAISKFGEQDGKKVLGTSGAQETDMKKHLEDADEKIDGDTATVTPKSHGKPLTLKKINGDWKVDVSAMNGAMGSAGTKMGIAMFQSMAKAAQETTDGIKAGDYKTASDARTAMTNKMMDDMLSGKKMDMPKTK